MRYLLIVLVVLLFSCKKEKLEGDAEILVGTWSWVSTTKHVNFCAPPDWHEELTPLSESTTYGLKFITKGKVEWHMNDEKLSSHRIKNVSMSPYPLPPSHFSYTFVVRFHSSKVDRLDGAVGSDTLMLLQGFPFPDETCNDYTSYFVRE